MICINESTILVAEVVVSHQTDYPISVDRVRELVDMTLSAEGASVTRVEVSLVDETTIQALNQTWRGKDVPTDVLSWPFDDSFPQGSGGEIVVAPAVAARNAAARDVQLAPELDWLIVHGTLHLLGYTDDDASAAAVMEQRTLGILGAPHG